MRPMDDAVIATHLENLDRRLTRVEQILPSLATKEDLRTLATKEDLRAAIAPLATKEELRAAVAPLATKEELRAAVAPLATKEELREEGERSRRYMTMLIEHQNSKIELLAEHVLSSLRKPSKE
jgi:hypothetical protein